MPEENKVFTIKFENDCLSICVDTNKDGQPVFCAQINYMEIPDEVLDAIKAKKEGN